MEMQTFKNKITNMAIKRGEKEDLYSYIHHMVDIFKTKEFNKGNLSEQSLKLFKNFEFETMFINEIELDVINHLMGELLSKTI